MTGRGRMGDAQRAWTLGARFLGVFGIVGALLVSLSSDVVAQAGRRRQPPPPPRGEERRTLPTEETSVVAPAVKKGAEIVEHVSVPEQATTRVRLRNGLTLIVRERYRSPLVSLVVVVKGGRMTEPAGIARLVARLLFRGTSSRPGFQLLDAWRALGGEPVVEEHVDRMIFRVTVPAEHALPALDLLADGLQHPAFDEAALREEIEHLLQEERLRNDRPEEFARARAMALALGGRSRGFLPLLEQEGALRALTRDVLVAVHRQQYRGERMVIAVVGAVNTPEVVERVQRLFGDLPDVEKEATPSDQVTRAPSPESVSSVAVGTNAPQLESSPISQGRVRYGADQGDLPVALVTALHEVPEVVWTRDRREEGILLLHLLAATLAEGRASRSALRVRFEEGIAAEVRAEPLDWEGGGILLVQWRMDSADRERVLRAYVEEAEKLRRWRLSSGELQRARALLERQWLQRTMTYAGEAEHLALAEAIWGSWRFADQWLVRLNAITAEQVRAFAERCLYIGQMTLHEYLPRGVAPSPSAAEVVAHMARQIPGLMEREISADRIGSFPEIPVQPEGVRRAHEGEGEAVVFSLQPEPLRDFSVFEGPRAFVREDRSRPILSIGVFFQGGRLAETSATAGVTELMVRSILRGGTAWPFSERSGIAEGARGEVSRGRTLLSAAEVALRMEQWGADVAFVTAPDFFGYVLTVPSRNQDHALRGLLSLIERPALSDEEIRREQAQLLLEIRARRADPWERSRALAARALYGDTPYGRAPEGDEETVRALTPDQVRAWYANTIARQFPLIVIVGDTDGSALISNIVAREIRRQDVARIFYAALPKPPGEAPSPAEEAPTRSVVHTFAWLGPSSPSEDEPALYVWRAHLAGWGSEVWRELRTVAASALEIRVEPRRLGGMITLTVAAAPEHAARVRQIIEQHVTRLSKEPLSEEAQRRAIHRAVTECAELFDDHAALVRAYASAFFAAAHPQQVEQCAPKRRAVTPADLQRVAATYVPFARAVVGVVRPRSEPSSRPEDRARTP
jgi:zinc protease